jgi:hypothetical protein
MFLRIARLVIVGAGLATLAMIVFTSMDRNSYFCYRFEDRTQWEFPAVGVAMTAVATLFATALLYFAFGLAKPGRVWGRALLAISLLAPWGWWVSEFIVHAPRYWHFHVLWVWSAIGSLSVGLVVSGAQNVRTSIIERRHRHV